jgi:filamentous hemagglutinin family protein
MMGKLRKISKMYYFRQIVACFLVFFMSFVMPAQVALANIGDGGWDVAEGSANINAAGGTADAYIELLSNQTVINWRDYNTDPGQLVQYIKSVGGIPAVLNRINSGNPTYFNGILKANGIDCYVLNSNGLVFGPSAYIQAHRFVGSALDISDSDFMNGVYNFTGDGVGKVINYGNISAEQVALIGKQVLNAGVIRSPGGYVLMAAGDKVYLGQEGSDIVVEIEGVTVPNPTDAASAGLGDVINEGVVDASGGKIVLAAGDTFSRAIDGLDTLALAVEDGTGHVGQFGTLNADGTEGDGGSITLTAGDVVTLGSDSLTTANAGTNGDGGEVIVYSPDTAVFLLILGHHRERQVHFLLTHTIS